MTSPWVLVVAILALAALYVLVPWAAHVFARYRGTRVLRCPETGVRAGVHIDAAHAAWTSAFGAPRLRVKWCWRWPGRKGCAQGCMQLPEAEHPAAQKMPEVHSGGSC